MLMLYWSADGTVICVDKAHQVKRSPLNRRTPLQGGAPLQRRTRLRPVSDKRRAIQRQRRELVDRVLTTRPRCEVGDIIRGTDRIHPCHIWATDVHEPLTRARGGSIIDEDNTLSVCLGGGADRSGCWTGWHSLRTAQTHIDQSSLNRRVLRHLQSRATY